MARRTQSLPRLSCSDELRALLRWVRNARQRRRLNAGAVLERTSSVRLAAQPVIVVPVEAVGIGEAARRLGVHQNTLRKWADDGIITYMRLPSGYRRFALDDLERFRRAVETRPADGRQKAPGTDEPGRG